MLKYLQKVFDRLSGLKAGVSGNIVDWAGVPTVTPPLIQADMDLITAANLAVEDAEDELKQKQLAARTLRDSLNLKADQIVDRAIGIHTEQPDKLLEYNIPLPAEGQPRPVPAKALIDNVADDDDGIGFKLRVQTLENVDFFEWEKGTLQPGTNVTVLQPPYPFMRSSKKKSLVDDDVDAGTRYFYRVRGVNNTGTGEWSEPVSAVQ